MTADQEASRKTERNMGYKQIRWKKVESQPKATSILQLQVNKMADHITICMFLALPRVPWYI